VAVAEENTGRRRWAIGAAVLVLVHLVSNPVYVFLDDCLWGLRYAVADAAGPTLEAPPITIIHIDEKTRREQVRVDRREMSQVIDALREAGARAIGFDLFYPTASETRPEFDVDMIAAVKRHGGVVYASYPPRAEGGEGGALIEPFEALREAAHGVGYPAVRKNLRSHLDRVIMTGLTRSPRNLAFVPALIAAWHRPDALPPAAVGAPNPSLAIRPRRAGAFDTYEIPLDERNSILLDYRFLDLMERVSLTDVIEGRVPNEAFADRMVILGTSTLISQDLHDTPVREMVPGVDCEAVAAAQVLARHFLVRAESTLVSGALGLLGLVLLGLAAWVSPLAMMIASLLGIWAWSTVTLVLLPASGVVVPLARPLCLLGILALGGAVRWTLDRRMGDSQTEDPLDRTRAEHALQEGLMLLGEGRIDDCIQRLQVAASYQTFIRSNIQMHLARALIRRGDTDAAGKLVSRIDLGTINKEEQYMLAEELERHGQLQTAQQVYENLYISDVSFKDVQSRLQGIRENLTRFDRDSVGDMICQRILDHRYRDVEKIGVGGMGFVFRATDAERDDLPVAIKVLSPLLANEQQIYDRFIREARGIAELQHPNLIRIFDVFQANLPYYTMEFLEGKPLKDVMASHGRLTIDVIVKITRQAGAGLAFAHDRGIVHRDIKPDNILITTHAGVKLIDFGIAHFGEATKMTMTGQVMGTPMYMSPEQVRGQETDLRSDVFSFGVILYEALTGRLPYEGMMQRMMEPPAPFPPELAIPPAVQDVVMRCLARSPEGRPSSMNELVEAMDAAAGVAPQS
jgi:CHASE2 domain-containing sensor protein